MSWSDNEGRIHGMRDNKLERGSLGLSKAHIRLSTTEMYNK